MAGCRQVAGISPKLLGVVCLHAWLRLEGNEPTVNFTEALDVEAKITKNGLADVGDACI